MADGHPKFGNEGGSPPLLDLGQVGGVRHAAEQAHFTTYSQSGALQPREIKTTLPENDLVFVDNLGFDGQLYTLVGLLRADSSARLDTIEAEIMQRIDGVYRDRTTGSRSTDTTMLLPTTLTSPSGAVIGTRVRLKEYRPQGAGG